TKQCELFEKAGNPIISVDCKKKEQIGKFKNNGKEWTKQGKENEVQVNAYDFRSLAEGLAIPYGIYDRLKKQGFVNVGINHDTAAFAVESIRRWWKEYGNIQYPHATGILITADGGGSNGVRNRLFKRELQRLVNEICLPITLAHYPPATSKWNVIEHQLFSYISINWRAKPLTSLAVILELISHTTTASGLTVSAMADNNHYETGLKVTDEEIEKLNIMRNEFHGEWNYTIKPQSALL
ncbi:MAG: ISAzo13 family transposase, partial [Candidatus Methanoperedens sp.]|nr:ISAzo13 family transposase [Candidatus Methanoperedens sp.]